MDPNANQPSNAVVTLLNLSRVVSYNTLSFNTCTQKLNYASMAAVCVSHYVLCGKSTFFSFWILLHVNIVTVTSS